MIIVMSRGSSREEVNTVVSRVQSLGLGAHLSEGEEVTIIGVVGSPLPSELAGTLESLPGVERVVRITKRFKLTGWDFHPAPTVIDVSGVKIGSNEITLFAGPCSVESEEQTISTAHAVRAAGARILRGGAYKPRTSPYEFRGLGERGLQILADAGKETGMPVITEVMSPNDVESVAKYADILQIGARNCQNYLLLEEVGKAGKPVMIKRGASVTVEEWLLAAEYVMAQGNSNVILCERGMRSFETATRFTLDIGAVSVAKQLSHLPVIVDPSHAAGKRAYVPSMSLAGVAAGADGLMIEVHPSPDHALSDAAQQLTFDQFSALVPQMRAVAQAIGRELAPDGADIASGAVAVG
ncbi:MAG TPA: 3-deoxy-7-phosphoheptulonate synthase [Thermomicrobiales bacterium]|jgi:3-deoxy-7-phosphoheptulonate synthase|nr:3-deoxy-7-phosphoheptulonate synthase [Thermomicrobiales bacterium]